MIEWNNTKTYNRYALPLGNIHLGFGDASYVGNVVVVIDEDTSKGKIVTTLDRFGYNVDDLKIYDKDVILNFDISELGGNIEEDTVRSAVESADRIISQKIYQDVLTNLN
ncbi:hypothetical protein phiOC_p216 [Ochrobactrum phage vB_OspM_OC]|nr:hypothetical protein phiOC_p216 [Ochrobactrum phage vB_OspM_OC]